MTALSFAIWAFNSGSGMARGLYKSARQLFGYIARALRMACAVCSILAFCSKVGVAKENYYKLRGNT